MLKEFYIKYKIFIIPTGVGLICLLIIGFIIVPQISELFSEREKVGTLTNRINLLNNKAKELENLDEAKIKQDLVTALTVLPTGRDVPEAMAVLQGIIAKSNLSLTSTSYSTGSRDAGKADSFSLSISVLGSIDSTSDFLINLKEGSRIFKVESITLKIQPEGSLVSVDLPLTVFYQAVPSTVLSLDAPVAKIDAKEEELIKNLTKFVAQPSVATSSTEPSVPMGKTNLFD